MAGGAPLLEHLKDLENLTQVLLGKVLEELLHRSPALFVFIEFHHPHRLLNDISVEVRGQCA
jgi:hypothetical protein